MNKNNLVIIFGIGWLVTLGVLYNVLYNSEKEIGQLTTQIGQHQVLEYQKKEAEKEIVKLSDHIEAVVVEYDSLEVALENTREEYLTLKNKRPEKTTDDPKELLALAEHLTEEISKADEVISYQDRLITLGRAEAQGLRSVIVLKDEIINHQKEQLGLFELNEKKLAKEISKARWKGRLEGGLLGLLCFKLF